MSPDLRNSGVLVLVALALAVALFGLPLLSWLRVPEDQTVDLTWARWGVLGAAFAAIVASLFVGRGAEGRPYRGNVSIAITGMILLSSLVPALGRHAVQADDAVAFGLVALTFVVIIVSNLRLAWKHRDASGTTA
ncbi:MAG: hypothetical protein ACOY4K_05010 [Pseudomonadota bacterium]